MPVSVVRYSSDSNDRTRVGLVLVGDEAEAVPSRLFSESVIRRALDEEFVRECDTGVGLDPVRLAAVLSTSTRGDDVLDAVLTSADPEPMDSSILQNPVGDSGRVFGVGLNYREHAAEFGQVSDDDVPPPVFFKDWASVCGPYSSIELPEADEAIDYEGELGVVIGRPVEVGVDAAGADVVAGFVVANDVTARSVQFRTSQWSLAKSFPTFCPMGPGIVPAGCLPDLDNAHIRTFLNGEEVQHATLSQLNWGITELITHIAEHVALRPGDVILTGTPEGAGHFREPPLYLRAGDRVEVRIDGLGQISNAVRIGTRRPRFHAAEEQRA